MLTGAVEAVNQSLTIPEHGAVAQLGRAPDWQSGGRGFDPHQLHQLTNRPPSLVLVLVLVRHPKPLPLPLGVLVKGGHIFGSF
jgi:hypothetical protein